MDKIQPNAFARLHFALHDQEGRLVDGSDMEDGEHIEYVHGYGMLVPGLEVALEGLRVGDSRDVDLSPEDGFGERDEELVMEIERSDLDDGTDVEVGDELATETDDGEEIVLHVVELREKTVLADANHPLAGQKISYKIRVEEVRAASDEEIAEAAEGLDDAYDHAHPGEGGREGGVEESGLIDLRRSSS